ncbi:MAG TPA: glycosyl hydrolase family 28 protein [Ginsengibacter sp.]
MKYLLVFIFSLLGLSACRNSNHTIHTITPNDFKGSDIERIQTAINTAKETTHTMVIPQRNSNGTNKWIIDSAILLPSNLTIILDNCTIQLSDSCRDNMFRSDNAGIGITNPKWNHNINIIGEGNVLLKGADNPRSTGDDARTLTLTPDKEKPWSHDSATNVGRVSYGSDAGKMGLRQKGDWRNMMILIAYTDGFTIKNVKIENSHAYAISFERDHNVEVSDIRIYNPETIIVNGVKEETYNKDGIDLRQGCKYFRITNITGINGDDLIALTNLDTYPYHHSNGDISSGQVTSTNWNGSEDDIEQIFINNCQTNFEGVAIRASGEQSIHDVYINGIITKARPDMPPPYGGSRFTVLLGGKGYGKLSLPGSIHNIYAMNLIGDGKSLIKVEAPVANCMFMSGIYTGNGPAILYVINKKETKNIQESNIVKVSPNE